MRTSGRSEYNTLRGAVVSKDSVMFTQKLQAGCAASLFILLDAWVLVKINVCVCVWFFSFLIFIY